MSSETYMYDKSRAQIQRLNNVDDYECGQINTRSNRSKRVYLVFIAGFLFVLLAVVMSSINIAEFSSVSKEMEGLRSENSKLESKNKQLQTDVDKQEYLQLEQGRRFNEFKKKMEDKVDGLGKSVEGNKHSLEKVDLKLDHLKELHEYQEKHIENAKEYVTNLTAHNGKRIQKLEQEVGALKNKTTVTRIKSTSQTKKAAVTPSTSVTKIKKSDQVTRTGINTNGALNLKSEITTIFITFLSIYIAVMRFF